MIWTQQFEVGDPDIDMHHQMLFQLWNELSDAIESGQIGEVLDEALRRLADYASYHFSAEEDFVEAYVPSEFELQHTAHMEFREKIEDLKSRCLKDKSELSDEVMLWMKKWLTGHVLGVDQRLTPYLKDRNG